MILIPYSSLFILFFILLIVILSHSPVDPANNAEGGARELHEGGPRVELRVSGNGYAQPTSSGTG